MEERNMSTELPALELVIGPKFAGDPKVNSALQIILGQVNMKPADFNRELAEFALTGEAKLDLADGDFKIRCETKNGYATQITFVSHGTEAEKPGEKFNIKISVLNDGTEVNEIDIKNKVKLNKDGRTIDCDIPENYKLKGGKVESSKHEVSIFTGHADLRNPSPAEQLIGTNIARNSTAISSANKMLSITGLTLDDVCAAWGEGKDILHENGYEIFLNKSKGENPYLLRVYPKWSFNNPCVIIGTNNVITEKGFVPQDDLGLTMESVVEEGGMKTYTKKTYTPQKIISSNGHAVNTIKYEKEETCVAPEPIALP